MTVSAPTRVSFLLVPGFMLSAYALFTDALRLANWRSGKALFSWETCSPDNAAAVANDGTRIEPTATLGSPSAPDAAFVAAGFSPELGCTPSVFQWLRRLDRAGAILGGWDTGAIVLAEAGVMANRRMSVHWQAAPALENRYANIEVGQSNIAADDRRFTAPGGISTFDLALLFISRRCGAMVARQVERSANRHVQSVFSTQDDEIAILPRRVRVAAALMQENLEVPISIPDVAKHSGISQRGLNRAFKESTGLAPAQYYLHLRLGLARDLLRQSDRSILDVALASGFTSTSQFSQACKRRFGVSPREMRMQSSWLQFSNGKSARGLVETNYDIESPHK